MEFSAEKVLKNRFFQEIPRYYPRKITFCEKNVRKISPRFLASVGLNYICSISTYTYCYLKNLTETGGKIGQMAKNGYIFLALCANKAYVSLFTLENFRTFYTF
jgi:hypothetical protein